MPIKEQKLSFIIKKLHWTGSQSLLLPDRGKSFKSWIASAQKTDVLVWIYGMNKLKLNIKIVWRTFSANAPAYIEITQVQDYYFVMRIYDRKRKEGSWKFNLEGNERHVCYYCLLICLAVLGLLCSKVCRISVPRPGIKPASFALQGKFLTTKLPKKVPCILFVKNWGFTKIQW